MIDLRNEFASRGAWSVAALLREVGDLLAARFVVCTVQGEISGFSRAASGHCYFNLKDSAGDPALLRCAMFRRAAMLLDFKPADGQRVEVRGRLGVYESRGELQVVVEVMQRAGAGALYEQFLRTRLRLENEGLFDPARKRKLPLHPQSIGVVTSLGAAALQDVLAALVRRVPQVAVIVYPSAVQGAGAPEALAAAIGLASSRREVDALVVCRGGGSLEDLWAFNDERVVRAIVDASMPVVCGVGHESDVTLADLAADLRAPTPTAAAELIAPARETSLAALEVQAIAMRRRLRHAVEQNHQRLDRMAMRLAVPGYQVRQQRERLGLLAHRLATQLPRASAAHSARLAQYETALHRAVARRLRAHSERLDAIADRIRALDPHRVLARGYAWLRNEQGQPIGSVKQLASGDALQAVLHDGMADMLVTNVAGRTNG
jgi:exodeoxyribonuclease VII large subunit